MTNFFKSKIDLSEGPRNADHEKELLQQCYDAKMGASKEPITDNDFRELQWWREAVEEYISMGWPISLPTIKFLWHKLTLTDEDASSTSADRTLAKRAIEALFDFSTSAVTYGSGDSFDNSVRRYDERTQRKPGGININQDVFLEEMPTGSVVPTEIGLMDKLDKFALSIADLEGYDGVYCLCGVRGSGKSTILNRIAWYCRHWYVFTKIPILVRFDLATSFDGKTFARDLISEICIEAKKALGAPPFSISTALSWSSRMIGHLGRFCHANISWATLALLVLGILWHNMMPMQQVEGEIGSALKVCEPTRSRSIDFIHLFGAIPKNTMGCGVEIPFVGEWMVGHYQVLVLGVFGTVLLGIAYAMRSVTRHASRFVEKKQGKDFYFWLSFRNSVVLYITVVVIMELAFEILTSVLGEFYATHILRYYLLLIAISIAILILPGWWESYVYFDRTLSRIRSERSKRILDIPLFGPPGSLGWAITRLLPTSDDPHQLDKVSEPFLQELTKDVLAECVKNFERVIVLIDDVDAVPSEQFHDIIRLIRPLNKVPGVRCVLASPLFFHYALRGSDFGDVHSTIQASIVVGQVGIHAEWPDNPDAITKNKKVLKRFLENLVISRLRTNLREEVAGSLVNMDEVAKVPQVEYVLDPWLTGRGRRREASSNGVFLFDRFGTSKREVIRLLRKNIEPVERSKREKNSRKEVLECDDKVLSELKEKYGNQETILRCCEDWRDKRTRDDSTDSGDNVGT